MCVGEEREKSVVKISIFGSFFVYVGFPFVCYFASVEKGGKREGGAKGEIEGVGLPLLVSNPELRFPFGALVCFFFPLFF